MRMRKLAGTDFDPQVLDDFPPVSVNVRATDAFLSSVLHWQNHVRFGYPSQRSSISLSSLHPVPSRRLRR